MADRTPEIHDVYYKSIDWDKLQDDANVYNRRADVTQDLKKLREASPEKSKKKKSPYIDETTITIKR